MNINLAELILESVPSHYKKVERTRTSTRFTYGKHDIIIDWHNNGQIWAFAYWENGKRHRPQTEGPAYQRWSDNGQPEEISYWENGIKIKCFFTVTSLLRP